MAPTSSVLFPWKAEYSVSEPTIDGQHQALIKLINDLHSALTEGKGKEVISRTVSELVRYTEYHFQFEEQVMRQHRYPGLAAHAREHADLTVQAKELERKIQAGTLTLTLQVMQFLKNWLSNHILQCDLAYARTINSKH